MQMVSTGNLAIVFGDIRKSKMAEQRAVDSPRPYTNLKFDNLETLRPNIMRTINLKYKKRNELYKIPNDEALQIVL